MLPLGSSQRLGRRASGPDGGATDMMRVSEPVSVLIVAESAETHAAVEAILNRLGQKLVQARSGRDALNRLLRDDFAAVFLDLHMTEMDGLQTAARIRRRKRCQHTPIMLIARRDDDVAAIQVQSPAGVECVSMPLDANMLLTKVGGCIELFQQTEIIREQAAHRVQLAREQGARQAAEKAMQRSALLADVSRELSRSLDFDATLASLHCAITSGIADAFQLVLNDADGNLWFAPAQPPESVSSQQLHCSTSRVQTVDAQLTQVIRDVTSSGHAQVVSSEVVRNAPNLRRKRGWPSVVVAPLIARDNPLGAIICCRRGARRRFTPPQIRLVEDIAGRAATALDNAQLYQTIRDGERRKDEFLATLGHELRNPLAAIANAGELAKLLNPTDPAFRESLEIIRQQASLMKRLVDDLLDVSRITSGRVQLQKSRVQADEIVARVAESVSPLYTSRHHALHLSVPNERICLEADPCRLEQVLSNLLVNSAKYTDPGGEIWLSVERKDGEVVFRVKDSGIGIGPDLLPNVFDLFSQANRSLHRAEGGLGIGLTIVKGLTELHGGRVWAASEGIGRGAEFVVYLPATTAATSAELPPAPRDLNAAGFRRRVLVVEDQPALLRVTVALLRKLGHDVVAAASGPEALAAIREHNPEVVFLDIGLPGMDGYEVAHAIRREMDGDVPMLVAMTGYGEHEVNRHAAKARFDHHLVKPADMSAMQKLLSQVG
jgi:signal transduction histidine kinase